VLFGPALSRFSPPSFSSRPSFDFLFKGKVSRACPFDSGRVLGPDSFFRRTGGVDVALRAMPFSAPFFLSPLMQLSPVEKAPHRSFGQKFFLCSILAFVVLQWTACASRFPLATSPSLDPYYKLSYIPHRDNVRAPSPLSKPSYWSWSPPYYLFLMFGE